MGLKDRPKRLERRAGTYHRARVRGVREECGERIKAPRDIALRITYAEWLKRRAERRGEPLPNDDPAIKLIDSHPHNALVNARTGNPPGLPRGVADHAR